MKLWTLLSVLLSVGVSVYAVTPGAISSATAGSGRGAVEASESPFLNPATISYLRGYYFTSSYNSASTKGTDLTLSLTDHLPDTVVPTSLGYTQSSLPLAGGGMLKTSDLRLAMGEKVSEHLGVGLAVHHKSDRTEAEYYSQNNFVLAGAVSVTDNLSFGLVFDDILGASPAIPENMRLMNRTSAGVSYNYKRVVRAKFDLISATNNSFSKPTAVGGVESFMNRWLVLRVGLGRNQETNGNIMSAGMGFQGPKFGVHYAYFQSSEDENLARHTVDLAIPVW